MNRVPDWRLCLLTFLVCVCSVFGVVAKVQAQGILEGETGVTNPKLRPTQVTAVVLPQGAPPPPGLITPKDGAILTSGVVTFQWTKVEHVIGIQRYELYLNGSLKFGSIHNSNQNTDDYTLTIENNIYTLTLKNDKWLADGNYTWKVRVIDVSDRGMDSTTWRFTVDSTAPNILVTKVDGQGTAISAADPSTIPTDPLVVKHRAPQIEGHTEASSEIQVTVTYPDGTVQRYKTKSHLDGRFTFTLEPLPVRKPVTLSFTAIDLAGNSRVLDGLKLVYQPRVITIPLPPIIPQQPVLEISVVIPPLPKIFTPSSKNFPPVFGPLIGREEEEPEKPVETKVIEVPVFDATLWVYGWMILFAGYVISVFFLTRNAWSAFPAYLGALIRFWILGPSKSAFHWVDEKGRELPFYGFALLSMNANRQYRRTTRVSSSNGRWSPPRNVGTIFSLASTHARLVYPLSRQLRPTSPEEVYLIGHSWTPVEQGQLSLHEDTYQVPEVVNGRVVALARRVDTRVRGWSLFVFIPRGILAVELVLVLYLLWFVKTWLTIALLIIIVVVLLRDLQAALREKLLVYGEE